jgi:hypothetical protein
MISNSLWFFSGVLMLLIAFVPIIYWNLKTKTSLSWFVIGALVWCAGVFAKWGFANLYYTSGVAFLGESLPRGLFLPLGSLYGGLLTGIFEVGATLVIGRAWNSLAQNQKRALAIGLGAGAVEAVWGAVSGFRTSYLPATVIASTWVGTAIPWLVMPSWRAISTLTHVAYRMLPLLAVKTGKQSYFWYGFLLATAIDGTAGFFVISGLSGTISQWWSILAYSPTAIACIIAIVWCLRHWPRSAQLGETASVQQVP